MRFSRGLVVSLFAVLALCFLPAAASTQPGNQAADPSTGANPVPSSMGAGMSPVLTGTDTLVDPYRQFQGEQVRKHTGELDTFALFVITALMLLFDVLVGVHGTAGLRAS